MPLARLHSISFLGLEAVSVDVEVDVKKSERFSLIIVGLPDMAVKESKDRVLTALKNSHFEIHSFHCTVNLAPGDLKKEGALYDLPIALGLLQAQGILQSKIQEQYLCVGELGLGGKTRSMRGALSLALLAKSLGKKGVILPAANAREASVVPSLEVIGVEDLREAFSFLQNPQQRPAHPQASFDLLTQTQPAIDFSAIKGQTHVKRAMEIAAAGEHNLLLFGPPGSGKTLLAKALIGILPPLTLDEALEVTKIHSFLGMVPEDKGLVTERPFRAPHHTVSSVGLVGGGGVPRPGEISLAHHGILFLDELPEFSRSALEALRQPLENRQVTISRAQSSATFPTQCLCIAAMNPCPCGLQGHPQKTCRDTPLQVQRYRSKISGPLLDRIDMHIEVPALPFSDLNDPSSAECSAEIRQRVMRARNKQQERFKKANALMTAQELARFCPLDSGCQNTMRQASEQMGLSARAYHRILKVARTIADLEEAPRIEKHHLMEALTFRSWDTAQL